jgi:diguanylate cyclase (GGDEF)-like protein/PAS domain S-box-containing protein
MPTDAESKDPRGRSTAPARNGEQIGRLFEMTSDLLATISDDGRFTLLNPAWEQTLGWTPAELEAQPASELVHPDDLERTRALMLDGERGSATLENFTNRYRHRDGTWRWLLWSARREGDTWYAAAKDVTDRMWLERQALQDPLTGLPNRVLLMDRTRQALARLHRSGGIIALLFVDLDRFKAVNDSLGHEIGDHLLVSVSKRLAQVMRDGDTVARLGGDEFVVLAEGIESDAEAVAVAERVLHILEKPFLVGSAEVTMPASVGVSVARDPNVDPESILREADVAMYRAKAGGGRSLEVFDDSLRRELKAHLELESRLRHALPRHELSLAYQPILPLGGGAPVGCEALVRWHPHGTDRSRPSALLPPAFLPRAQDSELIVKIGEWVLHAACTQAATWFRAGIRIPISVNVSGRELTELDLVERVREELAYTGLPGSALCLEVSEMAILGNPDRARDALRDLKRLGLVIALDNFGAGPASLSLPGSLPLDIVKLDRGLIQDFERDRATRAMVRAVLALAQDSDLTAVAVGIETSSQLALARKLEYAVGQGFLLRQPDTPERLRLRDHHGAITSAPWRPIVRIRGESHRR